MQQCIFFFKSYKFVRYCKIILNLSVFLWIWKPKRNNSFVICLLNVTGGPFGGVRYVIIFLCNIRQVKTIANLIVVYRTTHYSYPNQTVEVGWNIKNKHFSSYVIFSTSLRACKFFIEKHFRRWGTFSSWWLR